MSACNAGDPGCIPGSGRSPGEGNGNPLQYSCLKNSMDRGAWWTIVHGVAKSWTQLSTSLSLYRHMWKMMLRERVRVLQTELNGTWVITGFLGTSHSLFCFVFTTFTEVRVGITATTQLLIHIVSQLYLTALLPESRPGTRKWWTLPLWVVVKDEWEVWRLILRFSLLLLSGGWFGSPRKEHDSWRGGP